MDRIPVATAYSVLANGHPIAVEDFCQPQLLVVWLSIHTTEVVRKGYFFAELARCSLHTPQMLPSQIIEKNHKTW